MRGTVLRLVTLVAAVAGGWLGWQTYDGTRHVTPLAACSGGIGPPGYPRPPCSAPPPFVLAIDPPSAAFWILTGAVLAAVIVGGLVVLASELRPSH